MQCVDDEQSAALRGEDVMHSVLRCASPDCDMLHHKPHSLFARILLYPLKSQWPATGLDITNSCCASKR